ncbi:MAG: hypothetical protein IGS39_14900 [Calothrix sp. C42_A2020_038]|nr:hypothetical protein [Calothrix sp. C42_A2020_038]
MIISNLSYIEVAAEENNVMGGSRYDYDKDKYGKGKYYDYYGKYKEYSAKASANADSKAFGDKVKVFTDTFVIADSDVGFAASSSESYASASTYKPKKY